MSTLDSNGILLYDEGDERDTFSDLLNMGQEATSDALGSALARVDVLEDKAPFGATGTPFVAVAGWQIDNNVGIKTGNGLAIARVNVTRTGSTITVGATGFVGVDIAGFQAGWVPRSGSLYPASSYGPVCTAYAGPAGVNLRYLPGAGSITAGYVAQFAVVYPLA